MTPDPGGSDPEARVDAKARGRGLSQIGSGNSGNRVTTAGDSDSREA